MTVTVTVTGSDGFEGRKRETLGFVDGAGKTGGNIMHFDNGRLF